MEQPYGNSNGVDCRNRFERGLWLSCLRTAARPQYGLDVRARYPCPRVRMDRNGYGILHLQCGNSLGNRSLLHPVARPPIGCHSNTGRDSRRFNHDGRNGWGHDSIPEMVFGNHCWWRCRRNYSDRYGCGESCINSDNRWLRKLYHLHHRTHRSRADNDPSHSVADTLSYSGCVDRFQDGEESGRIATTQEAGYIKKDNQYGN